MRVLSDPRVRQLVLPLFVLLMAAALRLGEPGILRYEYDEMQVTVLAKDLVAGRDFPLKGIVSSVGLPNTPMTIYAAAIPYFFTSSPMWATLFVALYNVVGVGLLYGFVRRYLGEAEAFFAGLVYAFNPWAVMFSRKIWAQSLLPVLVILAIWLGMLGFVERKRWAQAICLPVLAIVAQIHYGAVLLLPLYGWFVWQGRRHLSWRALAISVILCAILVAPFVIGVSRFTDEEWTRYREVFQSTGDRSGLTAQPLDDLHRLITGLEMEEWWAPQQIDEARDAIHAPALLWELLAVAAVAGALILARRYKEMRSPPVGQLPPEIMTLWIKLGYGRNYRQVVVALALWIGLPPLLFAPGWTQIYFHYFLFLIPALSILIGVCIAWLVRRRARWIQTLTLIVLVVILRTQEEGWHGLLDYVDAHATPGGMGTPLHYLMEPRDVLLKYDDVLIVNDSPWTWRSILLNEVGSVREMALTGSEIVVVPDGPFAVVSPTSEHLYRSDHHLVFPLRPGEGNIEIDRFDEGFTWEGEAGITLLEPALFDNGVRLIGYQIEPDGVRLAWQLPDAKEGYYQYFIHFEDADGNRIAQIDRLFWPCPNWRMNDRIYIRSTIDWPPETVLLRVGLYQLRGDGYVSSSVLNAEGVPIQQRVDIPITPTDAP